MKASEVIQNHNTRNPYEIAKANKIAVIVEPLGNVYGYYNKAAGQRFIHVNDKLPKYYQEYVVSHVLYPALKNQEEMYFLKEKAAAKFTDLEKEANLFSLQLRFDENELKDAGSFAAMLKSKGLTDADLTDLSCRLCRIWGKNEFENLLQNVISRILHEVEQ